LKICRKRMASTQGALAGLRLSTVELSGDPVGAAPSGHLTGIYQGDPSGVAAPDGVRASTARCCSIPLGFGGDRRPATGLPLTWCSLVRTRSGRTREETLI
jgi:hypothetical protein